MANSKNTPNLPGSARLTAPMTGTAAPKKLGGKKNVTNKVMASAKGKGMKGKNPYC
jgi:hypothetical protein